MKVQEVMSQAMSGKLTWLEAEEILGWNPPHSRARGAPIRPSPRNLA